MNTGYNFSNAKTYLITPKPNKTTFLSSNHQVSKLAPYIQTHEVTKSGGNTNKANSNERKEFSKINDTRYRKLLAQIEKYKQTNSSVKNIKNVYFYNISYFRNIWLALKRTDTLEKRIYSLF